MIVKAVNEELINKYYQLSHFMKKYGLIIFSIIFSFVVFSTNFGSSVISYSSSILGSLDFGKADTIGYKTSLLKKYGIDYSLILKPVRFEKVKLNLPVGIYTINNFNLPFNSLISLPVLKDLKNNYQETTILSYLDKFYYYKKKINLFRGKKLNLKEVIKDYNLSCINTSLAKSTFCQTNLEYALAYNLKNKIRDFSPSVYYDLFRIWEASDSKKCSYLKKVFTLKFNYSDIKSVYSKYCNDSQLDLAKGLIDINNNLFAAKYSELVDLNLQRLVNQWAYFVKNNTYVSSYIYSHINFISYLLKNTAILAGPYANIENKILSLIEERAVNNSDYDLIKQKISQIRKGNAVIGLIGLNSLLTHSVANDEKIAFTHNTLTVKSVRERILELIQTKYSKFFTITKKADYKNGKGSLDGIINVNIKQGNTYKTIKVPVRLYFTANNISLNSLSYYKLDILDKSIDNYLKKINAKEVYQSNDLFSLYTELQTYLIDYSSNQKKANFLCAKVQQLGINANCSGNIVIVKPDNNHYFLLIKFVFNQFGNISKVILPDKVVYKGERQWYGKELIDIYLGKLNKKLNTIIANANLTVSDISPFVSKITNLIKRYKEVYKIKQSGLDVKQYVDIVKKVNSYLGAKVDKIEKYKKGIVKLYLTYKGYDVIAYYNVSKNKVLAMILYEPISKKAFLFKNINLTLSDINLETWNQFKENPANFFESIDSDLFKKYESLLTKSK